MDSDPITASAFFMGLVGFSLFLGAPVALIAARVLMAGYRRRVITLMDRPARAADGEKTAEAPWSRPRGGAEAAAVDHTLRAGIRRDLAAYGLGVLAYAAVMTWGYRGSHPDVSALGLVTTLWDHVFPYIFVVVLLRRRWRSLLAAVGGYAAVVIGLGVVVALRGANLYDPVLAAIITNALPALVVLVLVSSRNGRVVALVFGFLALACAGPNVGMFALDHLMGAAARVGAALGLGAPVIVGGMLCGGLALALPLGALFLLALRWAYVAKWTSERSLSVDAVVVPFALFHAALMAAESLGWAAVSLVLALTVYKGVTLLVKRVLLALRGPWDPPRLLFLRVFRATGRRDLFARWSEDWRYAGHVRMITGPDQALTTLEPHELLDFVAGRLESNYVEGEGDLRRLLAGEDTLPDLDGRYRISEYFCRSDTWQRVFQALASTSDCVVMDLRGFSAAHAGARLELDTVAGHVDPSRLVLVVDGHTDRGLVDATLGGSRDRVHIVETSGAPDLVLEAIFQAAS